MGSYISTEVGVSGLSAKDIQMVKRFLNINYETEEFSDYNIEEGPFEYMNIELTYLENGFLDLSRYSGSEVERDDLLLLSRLLPSKVIEIRSYDDGLGSPEETWETEYLLGEKFYSEREWYHKQIGEYKSSCKLLEYNLLLHTKIEQDMWSIEDVEKLASEIRSWYSPQTLEE